MIKMIMIIENRFSDLSIISGGNFYVEDVEKVASVATANQPHFQRFPRFGPLVQLKGENGDEND